jgi:phosphohistidine phosphatase
MKKLILVRHAKSSWEFDVDDFERPLNQRGEANAPEMAERFLNYDIIPYLILTSGAKRAFDTAKIFAEKLNLPMEQLKIDNKLFHASSNLLLQLIKVQNEEDEYIMIFGHNPGLTDFINKIGEFRIENLVTCGMYGISWPDLWENFGNRKAKVFLYDFPKKKKDSL